MFHGLDNRFLYSANQPHCTFANASGGKVICTRTGFWMRNSDANFVLITNRHVLDIEYMDPRYEGFSLRELIVSGKANASASALPEDDQKWIVDHSQVKYSTIPQNDIACLVNLRSAAIDGSSNIRAPLRMPGIACPSAVKSA